MPLSVSPPLTHNEPQALRELDSLTGQPRADDILLHAVVVCGPYSALTAYKHKVGACRLVWYRLEVAALLASEGCLCPIRGARRWSAARNVIIGSMHCVVLASAVTIWVRQGLGEVVCIPWQERLTSPPLLN